MNEKSSNIKDNISYPNEILYLSLEQSVLVENPEATINDLASVFCINPDINFGVRKLLVYTFPDEEYGQKVVSAIKLIEIINKEFKNIQIVNIGESETIAYYKNSTQKPKIKANIKVLFIFLISFLGSAFSIMTFNLDVNTRELLTLLHQLFIGEPPFGPTIAVYAYSIGLFVGVLVFFNHGLTGKLTDDPTPLQVQMRIY